MAAERRQVTVLFCDLVGSTPLSERLDPEELREVVQAYQTTASDVVEGYEGHIAQYLGDGILVYFGYPQAQEDAPRRAVLSGLAIVKAIGKLNEEVLARQGLSISVRIGIHTGSGVVGDVGGKTRREQLVIGSTPNIAARLQGVAEPDNVVISAVTHRLVDGYFACESMGIQNLKGVSVGLEVFRVTSQQRAADMLGVRGTQAPFVGREADLATLQGRFGRARVGLGQVMLIVGDAGIGKSRFLRAFRSEIDEDVTQWITCRCSPYAQNTAFFPLIETFAQMLGIDTEAPAAEKRAALEAWVAGMPEYGRDAEALLAGHFSIPLPQDRAPLSLTPQQEREATLRLLTRIVLDRTATAPLILVVEDLHWVDPSTLAFVQGLIVAAGGTKLLLLLAARPEFTPPWAPQAHVGRIELGKLGDRNAEQIVLRLAGGKPIPEVVLQQIIEKCDGVPLFIEELTKGVLESGLLADVGERFELVQRYTDPTIPITLQDSLTARFDRMGAAKEVLQLAAALGRHFIYELLAEVASFDGPVLNDHLSKLVSGELLYRELSSRHETFKFKHALIQDTAYASMLRATRRQIHEKVAHALERRFPETSEVQPELLARHFEESQTYGRAVHYLTLAGQKAMQRSALVEGLRHYTHALELLRLMPPSQERDRSELGARLGMGGALIATRGYAALDVEANYARARALCASLGDPPELFPVLYGLWVSNLARSHRAPTLDFAEQLLSFVVRTKVPAEELSAHFAHGCTLLYRGDFVTAQAAFARALTRYRPSEHWSLVRFYGDDHGLFSQVYVNWILVLSGKPETALRKAKETLELAEQLNDPLALAMVLVMSMLLHVGVRDADTALSFAERAIAISSENGFPFWRSNGKIGRGWARLILHGDVESVAEIREGLSFFDLIEQKLPLTYWSSYLIEALLLTGQRDEGLSLVERCIDWASSNVDSFYAPELYRLKGELLLLGDEGSPEAEEYFRLGLSHAESFGADFLGLRCAVSYARWLRVRGRSGEGKILLQAARLKLTEGAGLQDVLLADALLEELTPL